MALTWNQVLGWRMQRQWLTQPTAGDAVAVVRRLAGVQAQVASSAANAIACRQQSPPPDEVEQLLSERSLLRTWAMRGTVHLLAPDDAASYLSLLAASRNWEKGSWQRMFLSLDDLNRLTSVVRELLDKKVLTRAELVAGVVARTGDQALGDHVASGWGAVLKPLAWQGVICHGPTCGGRISFTRPDTWLPNWPGLPAPEDAASVVIPAYLGAHGPASPSTFDQWLCRGVSKKASLRGWFDHLGGRLTLVEVEGENLYARTDDIDDLHAARPASTVRLLPAFDQYILAPGTSDTRIISASRRPAVSQTAGWISPVVVARGRVVGTWKVTEQQIAIAIFGEEDPIDRRALDAEIRAFADRSGGDYTVTVTIL